MFRKLYAHALKNLLIDFRNSRRGALNSYFVQPNEPFIQVLFNN